MHWYQYICTHHCIIKTGRAGGKQLGKLHELAAALQEPYLVRAAELIWDLFAAHVATTAAAERMLRGLRESPTFLALALGRTGWNAYSLNLDYRTGKS